MKYFLLFLCCLLVSPLAVGQNCTISEGLTEIETNYTDGFFDEVLEKVDELLDCKNVTHQEQVTLRLWEYKAYRNTRKSREGHAALLQAVSIMEENGIPLSFDFKFLLAESYALRGDRTGYDQYIQPIRDSLLPLKGQITVDQARYHLVEYYAYDKAADPSGAAAMTQEALAILEKLDDPPIYYLGHVLRGLGNMNRSNGDFDRSELYYKQELELYQKSYHKDHFDIAVGHYNIANVYYEKLEYQLALDHYLQAHPIWTSVFGPKNAYMRNLNEAIGDMYWELADRENALRYFGYSVVDEERVNNDESEKTVAAADSLLSTGNYGNALSFYKEAYKWREKTYGKDHMLTGACKNFVARAIRSTGDISESLKAYQEAIDILVEEMDSTSIYANPTVDMKFRSQQYLLESLMAKGELLKELFAETGHLADLTTALETHEVAVSVLERMKHGHMSETSKMFWTGRTLSLIENSIETALQLYEETSDTKYLESAFGFSERSKSLLLLTSLNDHENTLFANVPEDILSEEKQLRIDINEYTGRLENEEKRCGQVRPKLLELYQEKVKSLQKEYDLMLLNIKRDYPEFYRLKYDAQIAQIEDLRTSLLDEQTALISYFSGDKNMYVFKLTHDAISVRRIDDVTAVADEVTELFSSLRSQEQFQAEPQKAYEKYSRSAGLLYNTLLAPELKRDASLTRLIIIPDGNLSYLPFESLLTKTTTNGERNYSNLPYLLKNYAISYCPSASIKLLSQNASRMSDSYLGFAPDYRGQQYAEARKELANLEFNTTEVDFATQLFNGQSWTGSGVTENILKSNSAKAGILHLAMHGDVEDEHPLLSKLYFNTSEEEDGVLHTYEIYNMTIPAQLVILSACNTATGKLERGEGILSLERAFQYAGSKSLLSTLWTVDDASSAKLTQYFLENLKAGKSKDIALQEAKLQFLETASPEALHPFYWSSFKLTGNTTALSEDSQLKYWLGGGIVAVFLVFIYVRLRQNKGD